MVYITEYFCITRVRSMSKELKLSLVKLFYFKTDVLATLHQCNAELHNNSTTVNNAPPICSSTLGLYLGHVQIHVHPLPLPLHIFGRSREQLCPLPPPLRNALLCPPSLPYAIPHLPSSEHEPCPASGGQCGTHTARPCGGRFLCASLVSRRAASVSV